MPDELLQQLAPGGRLVIPVGGRDYQVLRVITRLDSGFESEDREAVVFVPLLKGQA